MACNDAIMPSGIQKILKSKKSCALFDMGLPEIVQASKH